MCVSFEEEHHWAAADGTEVSDPEKHVISAKFCRAGQNVRLFYRSCNDIETA